MPQASSAENDKTVSTEKRPAENAGRRSKNQNRSSGPRDDRSGKKRRKSNRSRDGRNNRNKGNKGSNKSKRKGGSSRGKRKSKGKGRRSDRGPNKPKLSVVIPAYNEVNTIEQIIRRVRDVDWPKETIVVDDGSTDGTRETLERLKGRGGVKVIFHDKNMGKGAALRTAFAKVSGDIVVIQDADLEYHPEEYPKLVDLIVKGDADVVYGSRFLGSHRCFLYSHYIGNRMLTFATNLLCNTTLTDMETCYKAFRKEVLDGLDLRSNSFGFEAEFTAKVFKRRYRVYEVPITYSGRDYTDGKKIKWTAGIKALYWLLRGKLSKLDINRETRARTALTPNYSRWVFDKIKPYLGSRVLELNAGHGGLTHSLLGRDLLVITDPDDKNLSLLKSRFVQGKSVRILRFDPSRRTPGLLREMNFDTIVCFNTLEKITDDAKALQRMYELLPPDGRLLLVTPCHPGLQGPMDKDLGRVRRYTRAQLAARMSAVGFDIEKCSRFNATGALGWLINSSILRRKKLPKLQLRLFNLLAGIFRAEKIIGPPFGLSLMAVARKKRQDEIEAETSEQEEKTEEQTAAESQEQPEEAPEESKEDKIPETADTPDPIQDAIERFED